MTKTARILSLHKSCPGMSMQEIAAEVGCSDSYVRVVARQRRGNGLSKHDKNYLRKKFDTPSLKEAMRRQNSLYRGRPAP